MRPSPKRTAAVEAVAVATAAVAAGAVAAATVAAVDGDTRNATEGFQCRPAGNAMTLIGTTRRHRRECVGVQRNAAGAVGGATVSQGRRCLLPEPWGGAAKLWRKRAHRLSEPQVLPSAML